METPSIAGDAATLANGQLRRTLTLPLVVLYGLGVTIGAGVYVLIGEVAGRAGSAAPWSFVIAALVMAPTALAFAELAQRMPVAAGEAAYVRAGFGSDWLSLLTGGLVVGIAAVSAAAISLGAVGYIRVFLPLPHIVLVPIVVLLMGVIAAWGIKESVMLAAAMTLIEIGGLLVIVGAGAWGGWALPAGPAAAVGVVAAFPDFSNLMAASLLGFFAFVGFESIVNVAEEVKEPMRTLPRAIFLTLVIATLLYCAVATVAVRVVAPLELAQSEAPLALVFQRVTGASPLILSAIAIIATLNGIVVQMIMASRVIYGLASQGSLPAKLASVSAVTGTPLLATALTIMAVLVLAVAFPLEGLAEWTSRLTLVVFLMVNAALVRLKLQAKPTPPGGMAIPIAVPIAGVLVCAAFLAASLAG